MHKKPKLIFFGDLAPKYLSGTSIAAQTNLDVLKSKYQIHHFEEGDNWDQHSKITILKISAVLKKVYAIFKICRLEDPEIFYSHLPSSIFGMLKIISINLAVSFGCSARIVLHLHRGDFRQNYEGSFVFRVLTTIIDIQTNTIISLSSKHKKTLVNIFNKSRLEILENTIEKEYKTVKETHHKISFLFISNYIIEKGILDILSVFKDLSKDYQNIDLHTYGNTFDKKVREKIEKFNSNNIHIHDEIKGEKKFKVIANSNFFILPSWNEGQPLVIMEAMSQGTSVIASNVGFVSETLGENYPYLFEAKNKKSLEKVLIEAINNSNNGIGIQLQKRYFKMFSNKKHNIKLLTIFENIKLRKSKNPN